MGFCHHVCQTFMFMFKYKNAGHFRYCVGVHSIIEKLSVSAVVFTSFCVIYRERYLQYFGYTSFYTHVDKVL